MKALKEIIGGLCLCAAMGSCAPAAQETVSGTDTISVDLLEAMVSDITAIGMDAPDYFIGTMNGEFDADSLDLIAGLDASLTYGCDWGSFDLSSESLDHLTSLDGTVTLGIDVIAEEDQTDALLGISGGRPVYIPYVMVDGEQVTDVPRMTTTLFYETAEGEDPADVRLVSLNPEGGYTKVDTTYENGMIVLEGCPSGEYTVRIGDSIPGDLDGDGEVTVWDYLDMKDILNGRNPDVDMVAADIDGDGEVTVWDYLDLKDILNQR